jgi:hypothetical protein
MRRSEIVYWEKSISTIKISKGIDLLVRRTQNVPKSVKVEIISKNSKYQSLARLIIYDFLNLRANPWLGEVSLFCIFSQQDLSFANDKPPTI